MTTHQDLLRYWFADQDPELPPTPDRMKLWFGADPAADAEAQARFGALVEQALAGGLAHWEATPEGRLALILLLDQLPRMIYRGSARAFAGDARARDLALRPMGPLPPLHHLFELLPLEHAEDLALQERCLAATQALEGRVGPALREAAASWVLFARKHRDIIAQFGRFPHRNAALGRPSTDAELAWLAGGGESFGQGSRPATHP